MRTEDAEEPVRILIVEDEPKTAAYLRAGLVENGFAVEVASRGDEGLVVARTAAPDLVILDVMLPKRDGWGVLAELRRSGNTVPVIFLTARDAVEDRVKGLELGADDYLVKPFAFAELLARVRALLRRPPVAHPERLAVLDLTLDLVRQQAVRGERALELTPKEFSLLALMASRAGEVVPRKVIAEMVWGVGTPSDSKVLDVAVRRLRSKVDDPFDRKLIQTVRGIGYALDPS